MYFKAGSLSSHHLVKSSNTTLGLRVSVRCGEGFARRGHIWKLLAPTERMGGGGEVGAWLRAGIIATADQTTSRFCLQLAPVRR